MLEPGLTYQLLRNLTSPVVAITSERNGKENGMISDAAVRASIVPSAPRVSVYIHKFNYSHDMIFETGRFAMHLLHTRQFDVVRRLGFVSDAIATSSRDCRTIAASWACRCSTNVSRISSAASST